MKISFLFVGGSIYSRRFFVFFYIDPKTMPINPSFLTAINQRYILFQFFQGAKVYAYRPLALGIYPLFTNRSSVSLTIYERATNDTGVRALISLSHSARLYLLIYNSRPRALARPLCVPAAAAARARAPIRGSLGDLISINLS